MNFGWFIASSHLILLNFTSFVKKFNSKWTFQLSHTPPAKNAINLSLNVDSISGGASVSFVSHRITATEEPLCLFNRIYAAETVTVNTPSAQELYEEEHENARGFLETLGNSWKYLWMKLLPNKCAVFKDLGGSTKKSRRNNHKRKGLKEQEIFFLVCRSFHAYNFCVW